MENTEDKKALASAADLRRRAEKLLKAREPDSICYQGEAQVLRLVHELKVHQIELEMQNAELHQARNEIELALEKYTDLYDFAPVAYFSLDQVGSIRAANLTAASLLGIERSHLIGGRFNQFVVNEHRHLFSEFHRKVFASEGKESCEVMLTIKSNPLIYVQIEAIVLGAGQECRFAVIDITERKQSEAQIKAALANQEVMLKEIHHRVKNNLQIISSLVSLQANNLTDELMREELDNVCDRIRSMALIHEKLYQTDDLAQLDFADYSTCLLDYLWSSHDVLADKIKLNLVLVPVPLPIDKALPCALILNELASNALKHAFPHGGEGEVTVGLEHDPATDTACLWVRDNGVGLVKGQDWRQSGSLGLHLVQILTSQLRGTVETRTDLDTGTEFRMTFPLEGSQS